MTVLRVSTIVLYVQEKSMLLLSVASCMFCFFKDGNGGSGSARTGNILIYQYLYTQMLIYTIEQRHMYIVCMDICKLIPRLIIRK